MSACMGGIKTRPRIFYQRKPATVLKSSQARLQLEPSPNKLQV